MSAPFADMDGDVIRQKPKKSPWVIVGSLATAGVLVVGLLAFKQGNSKLSQQMMRARIVAQGGTVAIMLVASVQAMKQLHGPTEE